MTPQPSDEEVRQINIDTQTSIPLYSVVIALPAIVAAVFWIASVSGDTKSNTARIDRQSDKIHRMEDDDAAWRSSTLKDLSDVKASLSRIEGRLGIGK